MKSLQNKLYEGFYKNMGGVIQPTTKEELQYEIKIKLDKGQTNLNYIDISEITDMSALFQPFRKYDLSKIDISEWNTSKVVKMTDMFCGCKNFNSDLSNWDVSNVTDMRGMFGYCTKFNSDLSKWNVSNVTDMRDMFNECINFNSDLSRWDVHKVEAMDYMFYKCYKFNSDLSKWDVSNVEYMEGMLTYSGMKELPDWYYKE